MYFLVYFKNWNEVNEGARCESRRLRSTHALSRIELSFLRQVICHNCYLKYYIWYTHYNIFILELHIFCVFHFLHNAKNFWPFFAQKAKNCKKMVFGPNQAFLEVFWHLYHRKFCNPLIQLF